MKSESGKPQWMNDLNEEEVEVTSEEVGGDEGTEKDVTETEEVVAEEAPTEEEEEKPETKSPRKASKKAAKKVAKKAKEEAPTAEEEAPKKAPAKKASKKSAKKAPAEPASKKEAKTPRTEKVPGIGVAHLKVLQLLGKSKPLTRKEISEKTGIKSGFTGILGHLEAYKREPQSLSAKGLIKIEMHDVDGKDVVLHTVTAAGRKLLGK